MKQWGKRALCVATAIALLASGAQARITRIEIVKSEPAFGGASFGEAGAYVHLVGRVSGELDPADPANALIQDISLAPRNARGMVEYSTNIEVLKPADLTRGNRVLLFEVNNRGNKLAVANFNEGVAGTVADRNGLASPGDGWLMRSGYTLVWFGWEMDVLDGMSRVGMPPDRRPQPRRLGDHRRRALGNDHAGSCDEHSDELEPADPELPARQLRFLSDGEPG